MPDKSPDNKDGLIELIKKLWLPVAGFIGAVTLIYNFYLLWLGDWETITYILAGSGLVLVASILAWLGFKPSKNVKNRVDSKRKRGTKKKSAYTTSQQIAQIGLLFLLAFILFGGEILILRRVQKLVIVIATFEGPEEVYGLHNVIIETLTDDFQNDSTVKILPVSDIITVDQGSSYARAVGKRHLADIVIWGWYRPTPNPNVNIHIEFLTPLFTNNLNQSTTIRPSVTLADLGSPTFQQQLGGETKSLIYFLEGIIQLQEEDYSAALVLFDKSLQVLENSTEPLVSNQFPVYLFRGTAHSRLAHYDDALADLSNAIRLNPEDARAYHNRGEVYFKLKQFDMAVIDFTSGIQLESAETSFYLYANRGYVYLFLEQYDKAVADITKAIQIDPKNSVAYCFRGDTYFKMGQYDSAIKDYSEGIKLDSKDDMCYYNRGMAYSLLGQDNQAILDFSRAIRNNPEFVEAYISRGSTYSNLKQYDKAIADFTEAIKLNPQFAPAYYGRGLVYKKTGNTFEADADFRKYEELTGQKP